MTQAHLDRIAAVDGDIHAFLHLNAAALETAAAVDAQRAAGEPLGPLAGVPVAIKDVLCTLDMPSTAGSKILEGWIPPYDATVVARMRAAGLVPLGKTNMDEFAMGSSTEHSAYGNTHNPWDLSRIPGGSGGGSAAAVSAFEAPLALGSDTGGSIRQPGGRHRFGRHEADLRRGVALRRDRARVVARPGGSGDADGARRRVCCTTSSAGTTRATRRAFRMPGRRSPTPRGPGSARVR